MKKIIYLWLFLILWIWLVFASGKLLKTWNNWDAHVSSSNLANDVFTLSWRLDLEDSRTSLYNNWYRWKITWEVISQLYWIFNIESPWFKLDFSSSNPGSVECWESWVLEKYSISWKIKSNNWWELIIQSWSYFCSNQYVYLKFKSNSIWEKEIWNWTTQSDLVDDFWKQEIAISWITKLKGSTNSEILNRWDWKFNNLWVSISSKTITNKNISKNIFNLFRTYKSYIKINEYYLNNFNNSSIVNNNWEKFYLYDYMWQTENISFNWNNYINKWKILTLWNDWNSKIKINWKNTIIVRWWNIYINSNLYNENDNNSLLVLVAKRDKNFWNWWNIYINPDVTNIDAVLIADGSLMTMAWNKILDPYNYKNSIRKQLLIYGSVLSSNVVWSDKIPYWADLYENGYNFINNDNIYDLWNLRTFNLNYGWWEWTDPDCDNPNKLTPINTWKYSWAWRKECYIDDLWDSDLRKSTKKNPLIIEYNNMLQFNSPYILKSN